VNGGRNRTFAAGVETAQLVERVGEKRFPAQDEARIRSLGLYQQSFSTLSGVFISPYCSLSGGADSDYRPKLGGKILNPLSKRSLVCRYHTWGAICQASSVTCAVTQHYHSENNQANREASGCINHPPGSGIRHKRAENHRRWITKQTGRLNKVGEAIFATITTTGSHRRVNGVYVGLVARELKDFSKRSGSSERNRCSRVGSNNLAIGLLSLG